ncbi:MAG: SpoVA/SpoVAEb family sporulation membrane protein [Clostridia bacterium]|nr:SpoVA/SpoVAEb family sporulation membrane protein [Clostridia bacterium]
MLLKLIFAFIVGGALCAIAQILIDKTALTPAKILVLYVTVGVGVGAVGLYEPLVKLAGAGITLPLVGFGGAVARGVKEAVDAEGLWGVIKGPVTSMSAGVNAALLCGFVASLFFKGKSKRL